MKHVQDPFDLRVPNEVTVHPQNCRVKMKELNPGPFQLDTIGGILSGANVAGAQDPKVIT